MSELEFNKIVAKNIRYYLERSELTQKELAKLLGVGQTSVYNWLNAIKTPRSDKIDAMCNIFSCKRADLLLDKTAATPPADPAQDYARLIAYLDSHPEHRQLVSDALKVRTEDIDMIRPLLQRCADPDSTAPDLDTCKSSHGANSGTLDTLEDTLHPITLTDENLALVRDTPEVLAAEAEYIKKTSEHPVRRAAAPSPSTEDTGRKSG